MQARIDAWVATAALEDIENCTYACDSLKDDYGIEGNFAALFHFEENNS